MYVRIHRVGPNRTYKNTACIWSYTAYIYIYIYTVHNVSNGEIKVLFFDIAQTFKNL